MHKLIILITVTVIHFYGGVECRGGGSSNRRTDFQGYDQVTSQNFNQNYGFDSAYDFDYRQYKLIRAQPVTDRQKNALQALEEKVDFWTEPESVNSTVDFLVSPGYFGAVAEFLSANGIWAEILDNNIAEAIQRQQREDVQQPTIYREGQDVEDDGLDDEEIIAGETTVSRRDVVISRKRKNRRQNKSRGGFWNMMAKFFGFSSGNQRKTDEPTAIVDNSIDIGGGLRLKFPKMNWKFYQRLGTIYEFLERLEVEKPDLVKLIKIGKTNYGRDMVVVKIGRRQNYDKPGIFIESGIHAREWISSATSTFIIKELAYNDSPEHRKLLDDFDFYILPSANPDGYEYSHTKDRLWRKNRAKTSLDGLGSRCGGVDLNRNFGYKWNSGSVLDHKTGSSFACAETYAGPKPWSEPESRNIRDFVFAHRHLIVMYLALHSYGQKVIHPWSHTGEKIYDWRDLKRMGHAMAEAMFQSSKGAAVYKVGSPPGIQYLATGGSDDWAKGVAGIKWVFLIELPDRGRHGFVLPAPFIRPVARDVFAAVKAAAGQISPTLNRRLFVKN